MIHQQWVSPATASLATGQETHLFGVNTDLLNLIQVPKVDPLVAALTSSSVLPPDAENTLRAEERREETASAGLTWWIPGL